MRGPAFLRPRIDKMYFWRYNSNILFYYRRLNAGSPGRGETMKKTILRKYARLIAAEGGKVQKGQEVIIMASVEQPEFARMVAEECYRCGAKKVTVEWTYQPLT